MEFRDIPRAAVYECDRECAKTLPVQPLCLVKSLEPSMPNTIQSAVGIATLVQQGTIL